MSNMNTTDYAADQHGRPDTSQVPGTGIATGPGTQGGVHASELGSDRSGTKTEDFTSGIEGTQAASRSSTGAATSHGLAGQGSHSHSDSTSHDASGLGGATATPQQQTMAGHKDASVVAASQPTTHETGSMLDVGNVPISYTHQASSHQPTHAAGQTHAGSARAGDNAHSSTGRDEIGRDATGRDAAGRGTTGMAAAGAAAAYAAHHHDQHTHGSSTATSRPVGSGTDPAHSDTRARDTAHSSGGPLHPHQSQLDNSSGLNQGTLISGHDSRLANTRSGHADHTSRDAALGAGAVGGAAAYGAHEHNKHKHNTGLETSSSRPGGSTGIDSAHTDSRSATGSGHHGPPSGHDHTSRDAALGVGAATGAAGYGAHEHNKHHEPGSSTSNPVGSGIDPTHADSRTTVGTEPLGSQSGHRGHSSRDAALDAGAVGGAAAYGAHEHNKHKQQDTYASEPVGSGINPAHNDTRAATGSELGGPQSSHGDHSTANTALAGAGAAGAGYGASRLARHHNEPSINQAGSNVSEPHGAGIHGHNDTQPSMGSSAGLGSISTQLSTQTSPSPGQYNTLSGGTPSGIAADSHAGTSTGPHTTHGVSGASGYTGNSPAGSGSAPYSSLASGTPSGIATGAHHDRDTHTSGIGHDSGVSHSGLKGGAAAAAEQLRSTGKVTHRCQHCNEEMDISKHFTRSH